MNHLLFNKFKHFEVITSFRNDGVSVGNYSSLNLSYDVKDKKTNVDKNRELFFESIKLDPTKLIEINLDNCPQYPILYSFSKDHAIGITHSDSLSLFFVDENKMMFGAIQITDHRLFDHVIEDSFKVLFKNTNCRPSDIKVYFAPSLMFTNNEIAKLKAIKYLKKGYGDVVKRINNKYYLDSQLLAIKSLRRVRIPMENMYFSELNTYENNDLFFSKKRKTPTGKMMSVIRFTK